MLNDSHQKMDRKAAHEAISEFPVTFSKASPMKKKHKATTVVEKNVASATMKSATIPWHSSKVLVTSGSSELCNSSAGRASSDNSPERKPQFMTGEGKLEEYSTISSCISGVSDCVMHFTTSTRHVITPLPYQTIM